MDDERQCTDPRDKIYGLLGFASDTVHLGVEADYEKNVVQAYTHVARKLIINGYMDMLSWCQKPDDPNHKPKEEVNGLPSWVPDFSSPIRDPCGQSQKYKLFSASGSRGVFCLPTNPTHPNRLSLAGRRIDTIKKTGTHWAPGLSGIFNNVLAKKFFSDVEKSCNESQESSSSSSLDAERAEEAKWRIPCFDLISTMHYQRQRTKTYPNAMPGYRELRHRVHMYPNDVEEGLPSQACRAYLVVMANLHNRKPFISSEGSVGLFLHIRCQGILCVLFLGQLFHLF
jgi:hypothetical protein